MPQITEQDLINVGTLKTLIERACKDINEMKVDITQILSNCNTEKIDQTNSCNEIKNVKADVMEIKQFMGKWGDRVWVITSGVIVSLILSGGMWVYSINNQYKGEARIFRNTSTISKNSEDISKLQNYNKTNSNNRVK